MEKEIIKNKIQKLVNQYNARNFQHVIQESQILLKKLPDNIYLINLIGSCHQNLGNLKIAADAFIYIIGLDKKNIAAYNNLGNVLKTQKKYDEVKNLRENISALRIQNCWLYHLKLKKRIETRRNDRLKKINYMKKL